MSWGEYDRKAEGGAYISGLAKAARAMGLTNRFGALVVDLGNPNKPSKVRLGSKKRPHGQHKKTFRGSGGSVRFWEQSELNGNYGHED